MFGIGRLGAGGTLGLGQISGVTALFSRVYSSLASLGSGATATTRTSDAWVTDHEGVIREVPALATRFDGARLGRNLVNTTSEDFTDGAWTKSNVSLTTGQTDPDGGTSATRATADANGGNLRQIINGLSGTILNSWWIRRVTGSGEIRFYTGQGATYEALSVTTSWQRLVPSNGAATSSDRIGILFQTSGDAVDLWHPMMEITTGSSQPTIPSEYVSVGVESAPYHGTGADGVKFFPYENASTVDGNGVVTEAQGAAISGIHQLSEPASKNYANNADDLSGGADTIDVTAGGTGDFTLWVTGTAAVTVAAGTATGTGFGQAAEGSPVTFNLSVVGTVTLTLDSGSFDTAPSGKSIYQVEKGDAPTSWIETVDANPVARDADTEPEYTAANLETGTTTVTYIDDNGDEQTTTTTHFDYDTGTDVLTVGDLTEGVNRIVSIEVQG